MTAVAEEPELPEGRFKIQLVVQDETTIHQSDFESWSYQQEGENQQLQSKVGTALVNSCPLSVSWIPALLLFLVAQGMATAVYLSGFLTDSVGRLVITQEQWDTCLDGLPDEAARAAAQPDARHLALAGHYLRTSKYGSVPPTKRSGTPLATGSAMMLSIRLSMPSPYSRFCTPGSRYGRQESSR